MSQTLQIANFGSLNILERSEMNADLAVGGTSLTVNFSDDIATDDYLYLGTLGSPGGEVVTVTAVPDADTITVSATTKPHSRFDAVTKLFGNQIQVYRAANVDGTVPDDGDFSVLDDPFDIDTDQTQTDFTDTGGSSDYWYKYVYYNATTETSTSLADSRAGRGGGVGDYASIESIKRRAGMLGNQWLTDAFIDEKRQAAQSVINAKLTGLYTVPFTEPVNPLITEITKLLAAGYILTDEYGPVQNLDTSEGKGFIERGNELLNQLNTKELELTGVDGVSTALTTSSGFQMWPNTQTATTADESGGGERMFRVSDRY